MERNIPSNKDAYLYRIKIDHYAIQWFDATCKGYSSWQYAQHTICLIQPYKHQVESLHKLKVGPTLGFVLQIFSINLVHPHLRPLPWGATYQNGNAPLRGSPLHDNIYPCSREGPPSNMFCEADSSPYVRKTDPVSFVHSTRQILYSVLIPSRELTPFLEAFISYLPLRPSFPCEAPFSLRSWFYPGRLIALEVLISSSTCLLLLRSRFLP